MKALAQYYITAITLAAEASAVNAGRLSRLPDINTPHGYLMRSRIAARPNGGLWFTWHCSREDHSFAGMGGIHAPDLATLLTRVSDMFNRQHKGGTSRRSLELLKKRIRG